MVEALACGCATLTSENTGVGRDLLKDAPKGFGGCLPRNVEIWSEWLSNWLENPKRAGKEGANWVAGNYGIDIIAREAMLVYEDIIKVRSENKETRY